MTKRKTKTSWTRFIPVIGNVAFKVAILLMVWYYVTDMAAYHQFSAQATKAFYGLVNQYVSKLSGV